MCSKKGRRGRDVKHSRNSWKHPINTQTMRTMRNKEGHRPVQYRKVHSYMKEIRRMVHKYHRRNNHEATVGAIRNDQSQKETFNGWRDIRISKYSEKLSQEAMQWIHSGKNVTLNVQGRNHGERFLIPIVELAISGQLHNEQFCQNARQISRD